MPIFHYYRHLSRKSTGYLANVPYSHRTGNTVLTYITPIWAMPSSLRPQKAAPVTLKSPQSAGARNFGQLHSVHDIFPLHHSHAHFGYIPRKKDALLAPQLRILLFNHGARIVVEPFGFDRAQNMPASDINGGFVIVIASQFIFER